MSDQTKRTYYIVPDYGGRFSLWEGYIPSNDNLHFARFYGFNWDGDEIWVLERTDIPDNATEIMISYGQEFILETKKAGYVTD